MSIYHMKVRTITGKDTTLQPFSGKVLMIVNTASKCGFTPQLKYRRNYMIHISRRGWRS